MLWNLKIWIECTLDSHIRMTTMTIKASSNRLTGTITADVFTLKHKSVERYQIIILSNMFQQHLRLSIVVKYSHYLFFPRRMIHDDQMRFLFYNENTMVNQHIHEYTQLLHTIINIIKWVAVLYRMLCRRTTVQKCCSLEDLLKRRMKNSLVLCSFLLQKKDNVT